MTTSKGLTGASKNKEACNTIFAKMVLNFLNPLFSSCTLSPSKLELDIQKKGRREGTAGYLTVGQNKSLGPVSLFGT